MPMTFAEKEAAIARIGEGASLRGSNTDAVLDASGITISGGADYKPAYGTLHAAESQPTGEADPALHYVSEMKRIDSIEDPKQKFFELAQLQGGLNADLAKFQQDAITQAKAEFNVSSLEEALKQNEALDKSDPEYYRFQSDSTTTANIRKQYNDALDSARLRSDAIYKANPTAAKLAGLVLPYLETSMKSLAKAEEKADLATATSQAMAEQFGTGHLELARIIAPSADPVQTAAREYRNKPFLEAAMLMQTPEDLVAPALAGGNTYARVGVIHKQAERLSGTADTNSSQYKQALREAEADFREMQALVADGAAFEERVTSLYPNKTARDKFLAEYNILKADPARKKEREAIRASLVPKLLSKAREQEFYGNVAGWANSSLLASPDLAISKVYSDMQKRTGGGTPISLAALASGIRGLPKEVQAKAADELSAIAKEALKKAGNGVYGSFGDTINLTSYINTRIADATLKEMFDRILTNPLSRIPGIGTMVAPVSNSVLDQVLSLSRNITKDEEQ